MSFCSCLSDCVWNSFVAMCRYVVLVSGLNLGSSWCDQLSVEMLVDCITGQLGGLAVRQH